MNIKKIVPGETCRVYPDGFIVRHMTRDEGKIVIGWYSNICATSIDLDVAFDALGTELLAFVGVLDGRVVGSAVRTPVSDEILYASLYYVEEECRALGLGRRISSEVAPEYFAGRIVCLDAHAELVPMNKRRGLTEAFEIVHYSGPVLQQLSLRKSTDVEIHPFSEDLFDQLIKYDNTCFVTVDSPQRRKLMERWVRIPGSRTILAFKTGSLADQKEIVGFACRRPAAKSENDHIVGPLYAENEEIAASLVSSITDDIVGKNIWMSVCSPHAKAIQLVRDLQLKEEIHMTRMYLNGELPPPNNKVFALTSIDICAF